MDPVTGVKAGVDAAKRLKVGDGIGAMTVDGITTEAPATALFRGSAFPPSNGICTPVATPPAGKALIIKSVVLDTYNIASPGIGKNTLFWVGINPCQTLVLDINPPGVGVISVPFEPGLAVPTGKRLWVSAGAISTEVYVFGFTVPADTVPRTSLSVSATGRPPQQ